MNRAIMDTFNFDEMRLELSEMRLLKVDNIDVLKSRSRLFERTLANYSANDSSINIDYHVDYFIKELHFFKIADVYMCNQLFVKDLANSLTTIEDFRARYPLTFLIVVLNFYECKVLLQELVNLMAQTKWRYLNGILQYLIDCSENSDSIRCFVGVVKSIIETQ